MILQMFEPGLDGVFVHATEVTEALLQLGRPTAVAFSSCRSGEQLGHFLEKMKTLQVPTIDMRVSRNPSSRDMFALCRLTAFCRRVKPALIHCHSTKAGMLGRVLAMMLRTPAIYQPHAYFALVKRNLFVDTACTAVERALGRIGCTITISKDEQAYADKRLHLRHDTVFNIPNGVCFDRFSPCDQQERTRLRKELALPVERFLVAAICRFDYQKDPLTLVRGFASAVRRCPDLHLCLVGRGKLASDVHAEVAKLDISDNVSSYDYYGQPAHIYRAADAFLSTARYEGMPLVVLEALATNLPCVLTDCPGHRDLAGIGLNRAEFVPTESPEQVGDALLRLYAQPATACNHRSMAMPVYSKEVSMKRLISLYDNLLNANAS